MSDGPYVFVRSTSFPALLRMKSISGCVRLVTKSDSGRSSDVVVVEDEYVQKLIAQAKKDHESRGSDIRAGSFVRVLNGETRDFCGIVTELSGGKAVVRVTLRYKYIVLETPVRNLVNLSHVPKEQRVFYYSDLVDGLFNNEEDAAELVREDLHLHAAEAVGPRPFAVPTYTRKKTLTALVKNLITRGTTDPMTLAKAAVRALQRGEVRKPTTVFGIFHIIKERLRLDHFAALDPKIRTYRDVIRKYGEKYKFSVHQVLALSKDAELGMPMKAVPDPSRRKPLRPTKYHKAPRRKKRKLQNSTKK